MVTTSAILLGISLLVGLVWVVNQSGDSSLAQLQSDVEIDVETFASRGRDHIQPGSQTPDYQTFPSTSGPHYPHPENYGFYEEPLPMATLVHNLEHGDIVIYYKPSVSDEVKEHLKYLSQFTKEGSGVLFVPSKDIEGEVVATAWTKKMSLSTFKEEKLGAFIYEFIYEGPEKLAPKQ